jgi:hypothetical protein
MFKIFLGTERMKETQVNLNVHEIGILLDALQSLDLSEETMIAKDYGSAPALFNKLYSIWERMDRTELEFKNDVVPSF